MCNETDRTQSSDSKHSGSGKVMPDCCGAMVERMMKALGERSKGSETESAADESESNAADSFTSVMRWMASGCCGQAPHDETTNK